MGETSLFIFIFLHVSVLLNSVIAVNPSGFTLRMVNKDSKKSPFSVVDNDHLTPEERFERLLEQSERRAHYIGSQILLHGNATSSMNPNVVRVPVVYEGTYYVALVGIGTFPNRDEPFKNYYLMIDTASYLTWLQCSGANNTFEQDWDKWPLYPWENSITYKPLPYMSPPCNHRTFKGECGYNGSYASKAVTSGVLATEKFTINSNTGGGLESINLVMGCGTNQKNFKAFGNNHKIIAGILGLGRGKISFPNRFGKFSTCFEKNNKDFEMGNTFLSFGTDATIGVGGQQTPMVVPDFFTPQYYLVLEDISVDGESVGFTSKDFEIKADRSGGCAIDSGSPSSGMRMNHFNRIAPYVIKYFERIGIQHDTSSEKKLCFFNQPGVNLTVPTITLHFAESANYVISDIGFKVSDARFCLLIAGFDTPENPDFVLGAYHQTNKRILYDIKNMALSFADEKCK